MLFSNTAFLLRIAQGDAYGAGFEYANQEFIESENSLDRFVVHPRWERSAGFYTDDTQMSIALAEVLVESDRLAECDIASAFVRCFRRDPREGYARRFQKFLEEVKSGDEFLRRIHSGSTRNGAAMRSVPLGVLSDPQMILSVAAVQARVTHDTPEGVLSSQIVALLSHYALYERGGFEEFPKFVYRYIPILSLDGEWEGPVSHHRAMDTVAAVFHLLVTHKTQKELLRSAVALGGDTDTVAAIALGIASARLPDDLPEFLELDLEPTGAYGVPFLKKLGERLMSRYQ